MKIIMTKSKYIEEKVIIQINDNWSDFSNSKFCKSFTVNYCQKEDRYFLFI